MEAFICAVRICILVKKTAIKHFTKNSPKILLMKIVIGDIIADIFSKKELDEKVLRLYILSHTHTHTLAMLSY